MEYTTLEDIRDQVMDACLTMVIGGSDTGKTTLIARLAQEIVAAGERCAVIDADVGQSNIGPPTTIGLGEFRSGIESLSQIDAHAIYFVGSPSPVGHLLPSVTGTRKMVDKARESGFQRILIDTTGLIHGALGEALKGHKAELVGPDLIVVLQREQECAHLIRRIRTVASGTVAVLRPADHVRTRSFAERKDFRERSLQAYFSRSTEIRLDCRKLLFAGSPLFLGQPLAEKHRYQRILGVPIAWAEQIQNEVLLVIDHALPEPERLAAAGLDCWKIVLHSSEEFRNVLAGLYDQAKECFSLGVVKDIDFSTQHLVVSVAENKAVVQGIQFSRFEVSRSESGCLELKKRRSSQGQAL